MSVTALHLMVHGRVQGVGFRDWASRLAKKHNLTGWVRNRENGTVEAVIIGEAQQVSQVAAECNTGPAAANVIRVDASPWSGATYEKFETLPTA